MHGIIKYRHTTSHMIVFDMASHLDVSFLDRHRKRERHDLEPGEDQQRPQNNERREFCFS